MAALRLKTAEVQLKLAEVQRAQRKLLKRLLSVSASADTTEFSSHRLAVVGRSFTAWLQSSNQILQAWTGRDRQTGEGRLGASQ